MAAVTCFAHAAATIQLLPRHQNARAGDPVKLVASVAGAPAGAPEIEFFQDCGPTVRLSQNGAACTFVAPAASDRIRIRARLKAHPEAALAAAMIWVSNPSGGSSSSSSSSSSSGMGAGVGAAPSAQMPPAVSSLEDLRLFLRAGKLATTGFYSARTLRILTRDEVKVSNWHLVETPDPGYRGYLFVSPSEAGDRVQRFLAQLGDSAEIRWVALGEAPCLEIRPASGQPCAAFLLPCRKSPASGSPDALEMLIAQAREGQAKHREDPGALDALLSSLFEGLEPRSREFAAHVLGLMPSPPENFSKVHSPGHRNPACALRPFEVYLKDLEARPQPQGAVVLVGRGQLSARSEWWNIGRSAPLASSCRVYTLDCDAEVLPDLVADIRVSADLVSIPDHSVDQFFFDGVTLDGVYGPDLVAVLRQKLKPGGLFISTYGHHLESFMAALRADGFQEPKLPAPALVTYPHGKGLLQFQAPGPHS